MAMIRFVVEAQNLVLNKDIYHWRVLQDAHIRIGSDLFVGIRVSLRTSTVVIMGLTQNAFHLLNSKPRDYLKDNTVFSSQPAFQPNICVKCAGKGKIDWVERATGVQTRIFNRVSMERFARDAEHVLLYEKLEEHKDRAGAYFSTKGTIFSRTTVDKGEYLCKHCHGVGLALDGRLQMFSNMPKLRTQLKLMKVKDYEEMGATM